MPIGTFFCCARRDTIVCEKVFFVQELGISKMAAGGENMLKKFKTVLTIACMAFVFLVMNAKAYAYTGTGTEEDPYVVYTYEEIVNLIKKPGVAGVIDYYKLGQDISSSDNVNDDLMICIHNP